MMIFYDKNIPVITICTVKHTSASRTPRLWALIFAMAHLHGRRCFNVHLPSGRSEFVSIPDSGTLGDLKVAAQRAFSKGFLKLFTADGSFLDGNRRIEVQLLYRVVPALKNASSSEWQLLACLWLSAHMSNAQKPQVLIWLVFVGMFTYLFIMTNHNQLSRAGTNIRRRGLYT